MKVKLRLSEQDTIASLISIIISSGVPTYRKLILNGKVKDVLKTIINKICFDIRLNMLALEVMPDHLHLFVGARPTHNPVDIIKRLKGTFMVVLST